ncbi:MAG: LysR family transcriptional regulator [Hyphomicrobiaceae bacterium]|nr:MAG: LysR family transcriptional regulator [Hyphomicrobiaceae bacterium]
MTKKMDLNALVLFFEVANSKSISSAAVRLRVPKSTISRKLSLIEHQIGSLLLKRGPRKLVLTDIGKTLYDHCQKIVLEIQDAGFHASQMQAELSGVLRVSLPVDFGISWLSRLIAEFGTTHPEIQLILDINNRWVDVAEEPYDVAIHLGKSRKSDHPVRTFSSLTRGIFASPEYVARAGAPRTIADLLKHDCIVTEQQREEGIWSFQREARAAATEIEPRVIVNNIGVAREIVIAGMGVGILPNVMCRNDISANRLVRLLPSWRGPPLQASASYLGRRRVPRKTKVFMDFLSARLVTDQ